MPQKLIEPRKRARQGRSAATFEAILEAAARIVAREGLESLNTNRVAEVAGVSVGSLYQYFPGKEAILTEIIRRKRRILLDAISEAVEAANSLSFEDGLNRIVDAAMEHQLEWPRLARALEYAETFLPIQAETDLLNQSIMERIAGFLSIHGYSDPVIAAQDIAAMARGMIDAAGLAGETDSVALARRVRKAVNGYLGRPGHEQPEPIS